MILFTFQPTQKWKSTYAISHLTAAAGYSAKENIGFAKKFDGKTLMNFLANPICETMRKNTEQVNTVNFLDMVPK